MEIHRILLFSFSLASVCISSMAADTIASGQTIRDGETIISAGGSYELGFFSPGNSQYRYVGIWYNKVANGTISWVANRDIPLNDSSGILKLDATGILMILSQNNSVIWSSNTSGLANNPVAQLLDSGNLVVRNEVENNSENLLWQSFFQPDYTFQPGMKLGTVNPGLDLYISSWKTDDDPSPGHFTFQLDTIGLQAVLKQGSAVKARVGPWNGVRFSGIPKLSISMLYNYSFVVNQNETYYTYDLVNSFILTRLILTTDGVMKRLMWVDEVSAWTLVSAVPADHCDDYALCGAYGICDISNSPVCGCLDKFVPKYQQGWNSADWSGGCVRRTAMDCQKGDGFVKYSNVKLPDTHNSSINAILTLEECKMTCLQNCSCMAFANLDITGGGSGCVLWFGDLLDIRLLPETGQDLYIRMASSEADLYVGSDWRKKVRILVIVVLSSGMFALWVGLGFFTGKKMKQHRYGNEENNAESYSSMHKQDEDLEVPHFDLTAIANATNSFSFNNKLGEGGFGTVYKGVLKDGQEIAVKRLSENSRQGLAEFKNEVKCIAKLQHRNLVKLLGYCIELEETLLIYEYMPNKSLDFYISDQTRRMSIDWLKRHTIINGIARGLVYLHEDSRLRIIHRDLKLSNILLDNEMIPKISDFGLSRIFGGNETAANTERVVGTYGYMSPEYAIDGLFSTKSDIFSFGVLVIEIVSGRRNRGFSHADHEFNLLGHSWKLFMEGRHLELIDPLIFDSCNLCEALRAIHVGLLCVQHCPNDRPSMSSVVLMLSGEGALPQPKEPGFFMERRLIESDSSSNGQVYCSVNEVTITIIEAR